MPKKWTIQDPPPDSFYADHPELPPIAARLLWNRNIRTQEQIDEFLNPDYLGDLHDPFLFNQMEKAVAIIFDCIQNKQKIFVHGDYDADGVCAAAIIVSTLKKLGAETGIFIPHRETDGYGLNPRTVEFLKNEGASLIITCDCGISNKEEIELAQKLGMKVIITDHHTVPSALPPADAIIHPLIPNEKYPDKTLSGGGVAFKLVQGLLKKHCQLNYPSATTTNYTAEPTTTKSRLENGSNNETMEQWNNGTVNEGKSVTSTQDDKLIKQNIKLPTGESYEAAEKWLLDLVALSTIGDMVPLIGESRTLVRYGIMVLNKTKNLGLKNLFRTAGFLDDSGKLKKIIDSETVSFSIVPRVNAAGRMDHANVAFTLLTASDKKEAELLADKLQKNNTDRQKITEEIMIEARAQIEATGKKNQAVIFTYGESWSAGILGLIASRLKDEFYKPVIVMTKNNGMITGSGRSIFEFNLIAAVRSMPEFFYKFGGHPQAFGFSLKESTDPEEFKTALIKKAELETAGLDISPQIKIDAEIDLDEIDWKLFDLLQKFEPFGVANAQPLYACTGLTVIAVESVGRDNRHLRLLVKHNSHTIRKTIAFGFGDPIRHPANWSETLKPGDKIDLAFEVGVNEWNGNRELQLQVVDIKKTEQLKVQSTKFKVTVQN